MPTVLVCPDAYEGDGFSRSLSFPAELPLIGASLSMGAWREAMHHGYWNVLGIYTAAGDYGGHAGKDGIDRFIGHFPACIAYTGDHHDLDGFAELYRDILNVVPANLREEGSVIALNIIRHAQKCVTNETAFMSGIAQRPALSLSDIDRSRAIADAKSIACCPPRIPTIEDVNCDFTPMRVTIGLFFRSQRIIAQFPQHGGTRRLHSGFR